MAPAGRGHYGRPYAGSLGQDGLDLAQLDPHAPDLHLAVRPAEEDELAGGESAGAVPTAVVAAVGEFPEPLCGLLRAVQVAARDSGPGDPQFPFHPRRQRPSPVVADADAGPRQRAADRPPGRGRAAPVRYRVQKTVVSVGP